MITQCDTETTAWLKPYIITFTYAIHSLKRTRTQHNTTHFKVKYKQSEITPKSWWITAYMYLHVTAEGLNHFIGKLVEYLHVYHSTKDYHLQYIGLAFFWHGRFQKFDTCNTCDRYSGMLLSKNHCGNDLSAVTLTVCQHFLHFTSTAVCTCMYMYI